MQGKIKIYSKDFWMCTWWQKCLEGINSMLKDPKFFIEIDRGAEVSNQGTGRGSPNPPRPEKMTKCIYSGIQS